VSSFRREVEETCALLGYYAASSGNLLPTFRDDLSASLSFGTTYWPHLQGPVILPLEDGTDRLSRNVGKKLPRLGA